MICLKLLTGKHCIDLKKMQLKIYNNITLKNIKKQCNNNIIFMRAYPQLYLKC